MPRLTPQLGWTQQYFRAGERIAVAVSGGADSVALLLSQHQHREPMVVAGAALVIVGIALYLAADARRATRAPSTRDDGR